MAPDYPVAWGLLGQSHALAGEAASAEIALRESLRLDPTRTTSALHLTWILLGQGRSSEARLLTERLRARGETGAELEILSAWALTEEGDITAARAALRSAERIDPGIGERALPMQILSRLREGRD
jgi:cytochrome c-type biogenesis protein CcmH/NrfG